MLDDTNRKILRILYNKYRLEIFKLDVKLLETLSFRSETDVKLAINELTVNGYLKWNQQDNTFAVIYIK